MKKNLQTKFSTRQYMLSRDFEVFYYQEQSPSQVGSHSHPYYEFYFFLEGNMAMEIGGTAYPLQYGDVVLIPPDMPHRAVIHDASVPYRRFVFWISKEYYDQMVHLSGAYGYLREQIEKTGNYVFSNDPISFNVIQTKVFRLIEEIHATRFGKEAKVSLCVSDLLLHLNRSAYEKNAAKGYAKEQSL